MGTRQRRIWGGVLALLVALGSLYTVARTAHEHYFAELEEKGRASATLYREVVRGWLGRYRALAPIYAHNPDIVRLLRWPDDGIQVEIINARLEQWNGASGAADTYVLDREGTTVAASNWGEPYSFVGKNYAYRPYYTDAMQGRLGRYFALGTASGKRGYYFSYPVRDEGQAIGVVVVKVPVDAIEQELRLSTSEVFVTDEAGVIVLAGHPDWRMQTLGPLGEAAIDEINEHRQFDPAKLKPIPISGVGEGEAANLVETAPDRSGAVVEEFLHITEPMTVEGWTLHLLIRTEGAHSLVLTMVMLAGAGILLLVLGGVIILQRRRRLVERLAEREQAEAMLERAVAERTEDLRQTQSELVQAGKLAALGQMSAALSHEFNQPLAAIRSYAENAVAFIERGRLDQAGENLARISRLTQRMAQLSKHLTSFARKPKDALGAVSLDLTLDESLSLLGGRIERAGVAVTREVPGGLYVLGGQTRLQHVLMNILGNAIDACDAQEAPAIAIRAAAEGEEVAITIEDNGTGIPAEVAARLFDPFFTTKVEGKGLGLGLSISYNIVRDFGGSIEVENTDAGARFTVRLARATPVAEAAE
ncbi:sensor histidine kinase [Rhodobacteraceae bacterium NNCM2]|nr:sensor histidine kinase [Coraliihabitans acroporae]